MSFRLLVFLLVFGILFSWAGTLSGQETVSAHSTELGQLKGTARLDRLLSLFNKRELSGVLLMRYADEVEMGLEDLSDPAKRGAAWMYLGEVNHSKGRYEKAVNQLQIALSFLSNSGDSLGTIQCLSMLGSSYGAQKKSDSALVVYEQATQLARVGGFQQAEAVLLSNLGMLFIGKGDWALAKRYLLLALVLEEELERLPDIAATQVNLGLVAYYEEDYDQSLVNYNEALTVYRQLGLQGMEGRTQLNLGISYKKLGDLEQALTHLYEAVNLLRNDSSELITLASVYNSIANIFNTREQYDDALENQQNSLRIYRELDYFWSMPNLLVNMGSTQREKGNYISALENFIEALAVSRKTESIQGEILALDHLGETYDQLNNFELAEKYYRQSLTLAEQQGGNRESIAITCNELAKLCQKTGRLKEAHVLLDRGLDSALVINNQHLVMINYGVRAIVLDDQEDFKASASFLQRSVGIKDSLAEVEKSKEISELMIRFKTEELRREVAFLSPLQAKLDLVNQENDNLENYLMVLAVIVLLLGTIATLVFQGYREKQRSNLLLTAKNNQIELLMEHQRTLNRELVHRSINHLTLIQSLLSGESRQLEPGGKAQLIVKGSVGRVKAMAGIVRTLFSNNLKRDQPNDSIAMDEYMQQLLDDVLHSYGYSRESIAVHLTVSPGLEMASDKATALALVVNELISNSLKYAFAPTITEPQLKVVMEVKAHQLEIIVADNGVGLQEKQRNPSSDVNQQERPSFGLRLIDRLTVQLKAKLEQTSGIGPKGQGLGYRLLMPLT